MKKDKIFLNIYVRILVKMSPKARRKLESRARSEYRIDAYYVTKYILYVCIYETSGILTDRLIAVFFT